MTHPVIPIVANPDALKGDGVGWLLQHVLQVKVTRWISTHRIILRARTINRRVCVLRLVRYALVCG